MCKKFATERYLLINCKKSEGEMYGTEYLLIRQNKFNSADSVRHRGNYCNAQLSDSTDCIVKHSTIVGSVNKVMANLRNSKLSVLSNIF